ncbi:hypothetical protein IHE31_03095 (plasmid) [Mycetohabitans rhizoxinica]|uniref:hypothetical protein n=1 Tax=Mycetohabitans rhizoxinica TaxID=412963 RepID=UPI0030CCEAB7
MAAQFTRRGRETAAQFATRLERRPVFALPDHATLISVDNSGALEDALAHSKTLAAD